MILVKLWMHISDSEQLKRFKAREKDPLKGWKLTDEDWRNREKRGAYLEAVEDMLSRTDQPRAPWSLIEGDSKRYARVKVIETVIERIEQGMREWGVEPPPARSGTTEAGNRLSREKRRLAGSCGRPARQRRDARYRAGAEARERRRRAEPSASSRDTCEAERASRRAEPPPRRPPRSPRTGRSPVRLGRYSGPSCAWRTASPSSPVRIRIASSTGSTKIFPSPTSPVRACLRIVSTTSDLSLSSTTHSTLSFGRTLTVRLEPRYVSTIPFWRPEPLTSVIERDGNPLLEQLGPDRLERLVADERLDLLHLDRSFLGL